MALTEPRHNYKPFEYEQAHKFSSDQQDSFWVAKECALTEDLLDWKVKLDDKERAVVAGVLKGFTQAELVIGDYWSNVVRWFPKPEIACMARTFSFFEIIHAEGYNYLSETLGLDDFEAFLQDPAARAKYGNLISARDESDADIARSLAVFSAFAEGVSLFSSFAVLMRFPALNKLKGLGTIVEYSSRDECFCEGTEVLTPRGWKDLKDISLDDLVAQYDMQTGGISFAHPSRKVEHEIDEEVIKFKNRNAFELMVTKNHEMVVKQMKTGNIGKRKAIDVNMHPYGRFPISGFKLEGINQLSALDKFRIAFQADGSLPDKRHTGQRAGYLRVCLRLSKKRKKERLRSILEEAKLTYDERFTGKEGESLFYVNAPLDISKDLSWVDLTNVSHAWCEQFIQEIAEWDGHRKYGDEYSIDFHTTCVQAADIVQGVAALAGRVAARQISIDQRKETYKPLYRIHIRQKLWKGLNNITKELVPYRGKVRCLTMPQGTLLVRYNGSIAVTGNCIHSEAGIWLFNTYLKENPHLRTDRLESDIYEAARTCVGLEEGFIDSIFDQGDLLGLKALDLKNYIRARANQKLVQLGYKPILEFDPKSAEAISGWFDVFTGGARNHDFFLTRETNYARGDAFDPNELDFNF